MISPLLDEFSQKVTVLPSQHPSKYLPWCNGNDYQAETLALKLHRELIDFAVYLAPTLTERQIRLLIVNRYRTALSLIWPEATLICHGSTATQTNLPDSDLDFVVYNAPTNSSTLTLLNNLKDHLIYHHIISKSRVISAKCPIINGVDHIYKINVDIAINNENGILNIKRHKAYFNEYPGLFPVLMMLKYFLVENKLDKPYTGGISSNSLIQMIIFIIQTLPKDEKNNCGIILLRFFYYFGNTFNYLTTGISTREGGRTFSKIENYRFSWKTPFSLSIEDPQNPGNFLGENAFESFRLREKCQNAYSALVRKSPYYEQSLLCRIVKYATFGQIVGFRRDLVEKFNTIQGLNVVDKIPLGNHLELIRSTIQNKNSTNQNENSKNKKSKFVHYGRGPRKPPYKK